MNTAVHETVIAKDNLNIALDGTWYKKGYSSLHGAVYATSVENGKFIDFEALTKYCSSCKGETNPCEYCAKNTKDSAG
ncbi:hypothetical protein TNCV_458901 [Trichonephila clavipes]|nr:hypothetical protein TNCV_458901 [Trichonephila clavipes]